MTQHNHPAYNQNHLTPSMPISSLNEPTPSNNLTPIHDLISASRLVAHQTNLAHVTPQPINWLWPKRIPLSGITLLDGDHLLGKTLLAHQIAAAVSSGTPMPDGSPTIQGNVILITPDTDHTATQLQQLTALGANLDHIEFLSFVPQPIPPSNPLAPDAHPSQCVDDAACPVAPLAGASHPQCVDDAACPVAPLAGASQTSGTSHAPTTRPFCLPEDLNLLIQTIQRLKPRLVIFDPFIKLLSRTRRITNERLGHLLTDLNLYFLEHHIACLLIRNCPAKGGHARPSALERSDHFLTTAASRLLLTLDPFLPDRLLLCHALNRHAALTPTLISHIQPYQHNADLARFTFLASHTLRARDFIENRPDTLHRKILFQHLLTLFQNPTNYITSTTSIHVSTLYAHSPHSSPYQIQRTLTDLLNMGLIERPARGLYTPSNPTPATPSPLKPTNQFNSPAATPPIPNQTSIFNATAATPSTAQPTNQLNATAATTSPHIVSSTLNATAATTSPHDQTSIVNSTPATTSPHIVSSTLNCTAATPPISNQTSNLNTTAATTPALEPPNQLNPIAATAPTHIVSSMLNATVATPPNPQPPNQLNAPATPPFTVDPALTSHLSPADAALYKQVLEANWRMTYMDEPRDTTLAQEMRRRKNFWDVNYGD